MSDDAPHGLAERLRRETRALHAQAERAGVMQAFLRGTLDREAYGTLLHNLHAIYAALEVALTRHGVRQPLASFDFAALHRAKRLAADLAVVDEGTSAAAVALCAATTDYVARLREIDAVAPVRLLAHAYTRYLGDLNGGQRLSEIVERAYHLHDGRGTSFYAFGDAADVERRIAAFRAALDRAPLDAGERDAVVDEAKRAFAMHVRLFEELAAG